MTDRTPLFETNPRLARVLEEVNELLSDAEATRFGHEQLTPELPVLFIVGAPRSGTTLALQWLANTGVFAYPTNLLSRLYGAPYLGARIQQLLTDPAFDFAGELTGAGVNSIPWSSTIGKTVGMLEPHEFSFFWRRFYPVGRPRPLSAHELAGADARGFAHGLALLQHVLRKPFAAKAILLQYNLVHLAELLPTAIVVRTVRDPVLTVRSLLGARQQVFGSITPWFSVEPPGSDWLRTQDPYVQVAGQVAFTNRAIEQQFERMPAGRVVTLRYEEFCAEPAAVYHELRRRMQPLGFDAPDLYLGPPSFSTSKGPTAEPAEEERIMAALETVAGAWERLHLAGAATS